MLCERGLQANVDAHARGESKKRAHFFYLCCVNIMKNKDFLFEFDEPLAGERAVHQTRVLSFPIRSDVTAHDGLEPPPPNREESVEFPSERHLLIRQVNNNKQGVQQVSEREDGHHKSDPIYKGHNLRDPDSARRQFMPITNRSCHPELDHGGTRGRAPVVSAPPVVSQVPTTRPAASAWERDLARYRSDGWESDFRRGAKLGSTAARRSAAATNANGDFDVSKYIGAARETSVRAAAVQGAHDGLERSDLPNAPVVPNRGDASVRAFSANADLLDHDALVARASVPTHANAVATSVRGASCLRSEHPFAKTVPRQTWDGVFRRGAPGAFAIGSKDASTALDPAANDPGRTLQHTPATVVLQADRDAYAARESRSQHALATARSVQPATTPTRRVEIWDTPHYPRRNSILAPATPSEATFSRQGHDALPAADASRTTELTVARPSEPSAELARRPEGAARPPNATSSARHATPSRAALRVSVQDDLAAMAVRIQALLPGGLPMFLRGIARRARAELASRELLGRAPIPGHESIPMPQRYARTTRREETHHNSDPITGGKQRQSLAAQVENSSDRETPSRSPMASYPPEGANHADEMARGSGRMRSQPM